MDNQTIFKLIDKELEELKELVDALKEEEYLSDLLIEIVANKATILQKEIGMLNAGNLVSEKQDSAIESPVIPIVSEKQEEPEESIVEEVSDLVEEEEFVSEKEELDISSSINDSEIKKEEETVEQEVVEHEEISEDIIEKESEPEIIEKELPVEPDTFEAPQPIAKESTDKKIIGERFLKEVSLNDRIAKNSIQAKVRPKSISSLKSAIGINDRFLFQRELFANQAETMQQTIEAIDQADSIEDAVEYLDSNFSWNENEASLKFLELVNRRFQN